MNCIICDKKDDNAPIEHIVSESLGTKKYVLKKGALCKHCNNSFSKFEQKALGATIIGAERSRLGVPTKKEKSAKADISGVKIEGDSQFKKSHINVSGLSKENTKDFDPVTGEFKMEIESYGKYGNSLAKLYLKTGIEAIFQSRPEIYNKYNFNELRFFLLGKSNKDWAFVMSEINYYSFRLIPKSHNLHHLKKNNIMLWYYEDGDNLLFKMKYGAVSGIICLSNKTVDWMTPFILKDKFCDVYPSVKHYEKSLSKN